MSSSGDRRVALVTGGSGGIGFACAEMLAGRGYEVLLVARNADRLREAAGRIGARWAAADCTEETDVERLVAGLERVDLFVHAAGIYEGTIVRRQDAEVFDRVLRGNLGAAYLTARAVLPKMEAGSRIVFIGSVAGIEGWPTVSAYSAAKAGIRALAHALAGEVEHHGIGVHLVTPGAVDTPMFGRDAQRVYALKPDDVARVVGWIESMPPHMVIREIVMQAVETGPFAEPGKVSMAQASTPPRRRSEDG